jgi:hypothetical protein
MLNVIHHSIYLKIIYISDPLWDYYDVKSFTVDEIFVNYKVML